MTTPAEEFGALISRRLGIMPVASPEPPAAPPAPPVPAVPAPNPMQGSSGLGTIQMPPAERFGFMLDQLVGNLPPAGSGGWRTIR